MFCPICGEPIEDGSKFCTKCGHPLDPKEIEQAAKATAQAKQASASPKPQPAGAQPAAAPAAAQPAPAASAPQQAPKPAMPQQTAAAATPQHAAMPQQSAAAAAPQHAAMPQQPAAQGYRPPMPAAGQQAAPRPQQWTGQPQAQVPQGYAAQRPQQPGQPQQPYGMQRPAQGQMPPQQNRGQGYPQAQAPAWQNQAGAYQAPRSQQMPLPQQTQPAQAEAKAKQPKHRSKTPLIIVCIVAAVVAVFGVTYFGLHLYDLPFGITLGSVSSNSSNDAEVSNIVQSGYVTSDGETAYYVYAPNSFIGKSKDSHPGIYACKLDGTGKRQIIAVDQNVWINRLSESDGTLVFLEKTTADGSDTYSVHTAKTDGSDDTSIYDAPAGTEIGGVYVYGKDVYMVLSDASGISVWQTSIDGSQQATQTAALDVDPSQLNNVTVTGDKQILYMKATKDGSLPTYTVCIQSLTGDGYTEIYSDSQNLVGWVRPSGNRVYFSVVDRNTNTVTVMSAKTDGSDQKTLYTSDEGCEDRIGAIDGSNYLLTYVKDDAVQTVKIPLDGSNAETLSVPATAAQSTIGKTYIVYNLDGKPAIFGATSDGTTNTENLYVMNLDGTDAKSLAD